MSKFLGGQHAVLGRVSRTDKKGALYEWPWKRKQRKQRKRNRTITAYQEIHTDKHPKIRTKATASTQSPRPPVLESRPPPSPPAYHTLTAVHAANRAHRQGFRGPTPRYQASGMSARCSVRTIIFGAGPTVTVETGPFWSILWMAPKEELSWSWCGSAF